MKRKKMTYKEFKEVLENVAHMPIDIYGWDGVLNALSLCRRYCAKNARDLGCDASAKRDEKIASDITQYLEDNGYYEV